jgi:type IV secretory pathway TrbL component
MLQHTAFSFSTASPEQVLAFLVFVVFTIGFFAWVAYLVKGK